MKNIIMDGLDYRNQAKELLNERMKLVLEDKVYSNRVDVFRVNYEEFENIVNFYKKHKRMTLKFGHTATGDIKQLLQINGHIKNLDDINAKQINKIMCEVRKEKNTDNRGKHLRVKKESSENSTQHSAYVDEPNQVEVKPIYTREKDWHDVSWLDTEPTDWSVFHAPTNRRPQSNEWNDYWENVWRWLYKNGKADYKMNSQDLQWYAGFKKAMGSDFADLWLDLQKVRGSDKNKELNLNTKGVGKA